MGKKRFARNIFSTTSAYFVNVVAALLLSPFIVHSLGDALYGLWTLVVSLTGSFGLLDLGVRSAVGQYVTRYYAQDDTENLNKTVNTAIALLAGVAFLIVAATIVLAVLLPRWVDPGDADVLSAQWALIITGVGIALSFPMAVAPTVTYACQRFDIDAGIAIVTKLLWAGGTVWVLKAGYGILGLAVVTTGSQLLTWGTQAAVARRLMPQLRLSRSYLSRAMVKQIYGYGVYSFLTNAAERLVLYMDAVVVAAFYGAAAVTYYAVGANLIPYYLSLISAVAWTFTPYATALDAQGKQEGMRRLLIDGTRGTLFLASVIAGGLLFLGRDFLALWMGEVYVSGEVYTSSAVILTVLTWSALVRSSRTTGMQILFGMRRVKFLAALSFAELVLNLVLSITLTMYIGMIGVALGTLIPVVLVHGVAQGWYVTRLVKVPLRQYAFQALRAAAPVLIAMATVAHLSAGIEVKSWTLWLLRALVVCGPVPFVGYFLVLSAGERRAVMARVFPRLKDSVVERT